MFTVLQIERAEASESPQMLHSGSSGSYSLIRIRILFCCQIFSSYYLSEASCPEKSDVFHFVQVFHVVSGCFVGNLDQSSSVSSTYKYISIKSEQLGQHWTFLSSVSKCLMPSNIPSSSASSIMFL